MSDHGDTVIYREITCKSIIGTTRDGGRMPFMSTINPYRGCEIGCSYCYARYTHAYLGLEDPLAFEREIFVKVGAESKVVRDLKAGHFGGDEITIGSSTDPYQSAERRYRITRRILQKLATFSGLSLSITTKSPLILDDLTLLTRIADRSRLTIHISLISLDAALLRKLEPKAATPQRRLETIRKLTDAGIRVVLFAMPVIAGVNDRPHEQDRLEAAARAAGAVGVVRQKMRLGLSSWPVFSRSLAQHFPALLPGFAARAARLTRQ